MSEPVQLAKLAREQLAKALNALQTSDVPDDLVDAAEPVAQAMGVLHRIERTNGADLEGREGALEAVRSALGRVQKVDSSHPAVEQVMEAIAASLSKVHALARYTPPAPAAPVQAAPVTAPLPMYEPAPQPVVAVQPVYAAPRVAPQPVYAPPPQPVYAAPPQAAYAPPPAAPKPIAASPVDVGGGAPKPPVTSTLASAPSAPQPAARVVPVAMETPAPRAPAAAPSAPRAIPAPSPSQSGGATKVDVELGIHSTSNFYKGLGGNDVIEHGGLFVATYKVLKINTVVALRVLLPGDYEFTASAVVQWTREGGSSEPGFGARFTQISQEGRQLVYRYTRNREPMFYDDL